MRTFECKINASEWSLSAMMFKLHLPLLWFGEGFALGLDLKKDVKYDQSMHLVTITVTDGAWRTIYEVQLPKDSIYTEAEPRFGRGYMFCLKHRHHQTWRELVKQLCTAAAQDDGAAVSSILLQIRRLLVNKHAGQLLSVLPAHACFEIGCASSTLGTQGACNMALHYCLDKPHSLNTLLKEGDVDYHYVHNHIGLLVLGEHDAVTSLNGINDFDTLFISGCNVPMPVFVNKRLVSHFNIPSDIRGVYMIDLKYRPIIF